MDARTVTRILAQNPWFAGLSGELACEIVRLGQVRQVRDSVLFAEGDEPNGLFAVLTGDVQISRASADGRLGLLLVLRAGAWFGETALFDDRPRFLNAFAAGPCDLLHLNMRGFRQLARGNTSHYEAFVRLQCDHYRLAINHLASLGASPVLVRLAQRLIFFSQADREFDERIRVVRLSQEELASTVGVSRQALSVHLRGLERQGIISLGYGVIRVHKRAALEQLIEQGQ
jgi:CRP/FNR family transcriptional regulator, cyclic AMP receptor protein